MRATGARVAGMARSYNEGCRGRGTLCIGGRIPLLRRNGPCPRQAPGTQDNFAPPPGPVAC